jgi:hypothetical protein
VLSMLPLLVLLVAFASAGAQQVSTKRTDPTEGN